MADQVIEKLREAYEKLDRMTNFEFGANTQAHKMALILQALTEMEDERSDFIKAWNARKSALDTELSRLRREVLTGQTGLFPVSEPTPDPPKEAA